MSVPLLSKPDDWTVEDLVALPDDGRRYETVDGSLVVSPAPGVRHEVVVEAVRQVLRQALPQGLRLAFGRHVRVPDVVVVREDLVGRDVLAASPEDVVLAVEVVSPEAAERVVRLLRDRVGQPA